ncbi:hypothetical protein BpHYR1_002743 [Brachionus plicatilis]|uniref:Uncharacterized protein n=1 Tax=Brachionus plicatilis TaxID=10195 RepID=A0A3M7PM05_BRAPC|nr:hypothetical protein BpHYR1_002743 [Brachionus plicatilis]
MNACRENLVAYWSRARAEINKTIDPDTNEPKDLVNLNLKKFHTEPIIENDDLLDAHYWNKLGKTIQRVGDYYMVRDGNEKKIVNCQEMNVNNIYNDYKINVTDIERSEVLRMEFLFIPICSCQEHELIIKSRCELSA